MSAETTTSHAAHTAGQAPHTAGQAAAANDEMVGRLLQQAGVTLTPEDRQVLNAIYPQLRELLDALRGVGERCPLPQPIYPLLDE